MTVDQTLFPAIANRPPAVSWPAARAPRRPLPETAADGAGTDARQPPPAPTDWPRVFPGL